jgi:hypothetical protein
VRRIRGVKLGVMTVDDARKLYTDLPDDVPGESRAGTGFSRARPAIKTARDRLTVRCIERHFVTPNRSFDVAALRPAVQSTRRRTRPKRQS